MIKMVPYFVVFFGFSFALALLFMNAFAIVAWLRRVARQEQDHDEYD